MCVWQRGHDILYFVPERNNRAFLIFAKMAQMMAMRKTLDERARKKALDAIFNRFDFNQNGNSKMHLFEN